MKNFLLISPVLAAILAISSPAPVFAHVGHGDEFQSKGGIQKVQVNAATDQLLGIEVKPIAPATGGGEAVMIPVTSLVEADGNQLVFVQYGNFYEPVPVKTGESKGDLIEITEGLSVGEKLVTQGSLTLYAESRKTKTTDTTATSPTTTHAQADAQGIPHGHNASGNMTQQPSEIAQQPAQSKSEFPILTYAIAGGGALLVAGTAVGILANRKKKSMFSGRKGDF
jgi:membrane fusion protein, cation efflux system